ncbi:MAG TPA: SDR family NAD(P)-dependent oxidoreductase, partial [Candidatus Saccharimonadia bacterium]|nr:SDR family NAD(P)-dependent oxidoreductase [Candidatus Saccharimonadia bacterium]
VNVASLAGLMPGSAGHTLYAASKSFLIKFSQSLALENAARGVSVTALCPGFTYSEFHDVTGARAIVSKMPDFMWMRADEVAVDGVDAVLRGDVVRISGAVNRAIAFFGKHLPDRLGLLLMKRQSKRFRVQD